MSTYWKRGQRKKIADMVGISESNLSEILTRKRGVSHTRALELEEATIAVLGEEDYVPWLVWQQNKTAKHPAFQSLEVSND